MIDRYCIRFSSTFLGLDESGTRTCYLYFSDMDKIEIYQISKNNGYPFSRLTVYGIK